MSASRKLMECARLASSLPAQDASSLIRQFRQDLGYLDRSIPENELQYEVNQVVGKSQLGKIVGKCFEVLGASKSFSEVLDRIKAQGYHYSTIGAITVSVSDIKVPAEKKTVYCRSRRPYQS